MRKVLILAAALVLGACSSPAPAPAPKPPPAPQPAPAPLPPAPAPAPAPVTVADFSAALTTGCSFAAAQPLSARGIELAAAVAGLPPSQQTAQGAATAACGSLIAPSTPLSSYVIGEPVPAFVGGAIIIVARIAAGG